MTSEYDRAAPAWMIVVAGPGSWFGNAAPDSCDSQLAGPKLVNLAREPEQRVLGVGEHSLEAAHCVGVRLARLQRGALEYAKTHGIALSTVTEGRFTFEMTKARDKPPAISHEEAAARYDLPTFVGHAYQPGGAPGSTSVTLLSVEYPEYVLDAILGASNQEPGP